MQDKSTIKRVPMTALSREMLSGVPAGTLIAPSLYGERGEKNATELWMERTSVHPHPDGIVMVRKSGNGEKEVILNCDRPLYRGRVEFIYQCEDGVVISTGKKFLLNGSVEVSENETKPGYRHRVRGSANMSKIGSLHFGTENSGMLKYGIPQNELAHWDSHPHGVMLFTKEETGSGLLILKLT